MIGNARLQQFQESHWSTTPSWLLSPSARMCPPFDTTPPEAFCVAANVPPCAVDSIALGTAMPFHHKVFHIACSRAHVSRLLEANVSWKISRQRGHMRTDCETLDQSCSASRSQLHQASLSTMAWGIQSMTGAASCASQSCMSWCADIGE